MHNCLLEFRWMTRVIFRFKLQKVQAVLKSTVCMFGVCVCVFFFTQLPFWDLHKNPLIFNGSIKIKKQYFPFCNNDISDVAKFTEMLVWYRMFHLFCLNKQELYVCPSPKLLGCKRAKYFCYASNRFTWIMFYSELAWSYKRRYLSVCVEGQAENKDCHNWWSW